MTWVTDTLSRAQLGSLGSIENPVVAYAPEGLRMTGDVTGTGVLLVDGRFEQRGGAGWIGLVVVRSAAGAPPALELRGSVGVTGGVLLYNETTLETHIELSGRASVRYSHDALDALRSALFPAP